MSASGERLPARLVAVLSIAIAVIAAAVLAFQVARLWPYLSDDSFISLRYAERLLAGKGLTWTDGERVEGYSNLLWVLGCAGLGGLGIDLVTAARVLGAACVIATFAVLLRAFPPVSLRALPSALAGPLLLAASPQLQVWTCGGLEGPMVLLWITWGSALLLREERPVRHVLLAAGVPFALLCLTRPDGPLWVAGAALAAGLCWLRQADARAAAARVGWLCALPAGAVLLQLALRLMYYGDWVPNTAHVKATTSAAGLKDGLAYVGGGLWVLRGALLLALPGVVMTWAGPLRRAGMLLLVPSLLWCAYLVAIGGDHFHAWRHLLAPLAACALLGGAGLRAWASMPRVPLVLPLLVAVGAPALLLWDARSDSGTNEARGETWEWKGEVLGRALGRAFAAERPLLACDAAGAVPFFSGLPCLDMLGLNDRTIATQPSREWIPPDQRLPPGHAIGNGRYVMDRQPDLMLFGPPPCLPLAVFVSAYQFQNDPRFLEGYRCAILELPVTTLRGGEDVAVRTPLWLRVDGRAGTRRSDRRIELPAILLGSYRQPRPYLFLAPPAKTDPDHDAFHAGLARCGEWFQHPPGCAVPAASGGLDLELRGHAAAVLEGLDVPAGRWRVEPTPPNEALTCEVGTAGQAVAVNGDGTFDWAGGRLDLTCSVKARAALPQRLHRVVLHRQP